MLETVCVYLLGSEPDIRATIARKLGKKGTKSDIALYTYQKQEFIMEIVDPIQYPVKPLSLFETINMVDIPLILISKNGPDIHTAEFALLLEAKEEKEGIIAIVHGGDTFIDIEKIRKQIKKISKGLLINNYNILNINLDNGEDMQVLRGIIKELGKRKQEERIKERNESRVDIDHVFPVKGIGTVILGRVRGGNFTKGEVVTALPLGRKCTIRSIQINDIDYEEAKEGARVGMALRGVLPKDIGRGHILTKEKENWIITNEIEGTIKVVPYGKMPKVGSKRHVIAGLQTSLGIIEDIEKAEKEEEYKIKIKLEKSLVTKKGEEILLIDLNGKPKTIGKIIT